MTSIISFLFSLQLIEKLPMVAQAETPTEDEVRLTPERIVMCFEAFDALIEQSGPHSVSALENFMGCHRFILLQYLDPP